jgi:hypothetical protein
LCAFARVSHGANIANILTANVTEGRAVAQWERM